MKCYDHLNSQELPLFNFERLDILFALIGHPSKNLWPFVFREILRLHILCPWIEHPCEKLWPLEFSKAVVVQFLASWYVMRLNRTLEWKLMTVWISRELPLFNFERLDILYHRIRHSSEKLWPFKFLKSFCCIISSVSIYYVPSSDIRVKSYDHFNFSRASIVQFRASWYIMPLNRASKLKVMTIWISQQLPLFNFERLDRLCALIGHPSEKLRPFEFFESFRRSI